MCKDDVIHKTGTYRVATPPEEDGARTTVNMHKNLIYVRPCGFRVMLADRQMDANGRSDKQTNSSQYFTPLPQGEAAK